MKKEPPIGDPSFSQKVLIESGLAKLFRADLHCLHSGFCLGSGFEGTIVDNGRGRRAGLQWLRDDVARGRAIQKD